MVWLLCGDRVACADGVFVSGRVAWCDGCGVFRLFGMPYAPVRASGDEPVPAPGASAGNRAGGVRPVLPRELQVGRPHRCPRWLCPLTASCGLRVQRGISGALVACMGFRVPACPCALRTLCALCACVPVHPCTHVPCVSLCPMCTLCVLVLCVLCAPVRVSVWVWVVSCSRRVWVWVESCSRRVPCVLAYPAYPVCSVCPVCPVPS